VVAAMRLQIFIWLRSRVSRPKPVRPAGILEAVAALRASGRTVALQAGKDDFQHWRIGDFTMLEADVIQYAVSRGLISDR